MMIEVTAMRPVAPLAPIKPGHVLVTHLFPPTAAVRCASIVFNGVAICSVNVVLEISTTARNFLGRLGAESGSCWWSVAPQSLRFYWH